MNVDWVSFAAGAVVGIFLITLARVVQRMRDSGSASLGPVRPALDAVSLGPATVGTEAKRPNAGQPIAAPSAAAGHERAAPVRPSVVTGSFGTSRPIRPTTAPLAFVADLPPEVVAGKLVREHPYLAAYVLDHLDSGFVERVLTLMGEGPRREVQDLLRPDEPLKLSGEAFIALLHRLKASALGGT